MGRAKLLEQFVIAWYYGISCAYLLFECVLKSAHIASKMSAPYASKKTIKMGLKDLKLFPMEQISVPKIQGRTHTRQDSSRVNAALKENFELFVFFKVCGPLAQATGRSLSEEPKFFTKAKIGLQLNQSTPWSGLGRPGATIHPGMSCTNSTSSSSTWTGEYHQELQENQEIDHDQDKEPWWATYSGSEGAEIAKYFTTRSSATSCDDNGPDNSPTKWYDQAPHEFQQGIDFSESQQQDHQEFDMWDSSSEGSCRQTTTSRRQERCLLTAKELEIFHKEMEKFFKNYKSRIGSESD